MSKDRRRKLESGAHYSNYLEVGFVESFLTGNTYLF